MLWTDATTQTPTTADFEKGQHQIGKLRHDGIGGIYQRPRKSQKKNVAELQWLVKRYKLALYHQEADYTGGIDCASFEVADSFVYVEKKLSKGQNAPYFQPIIRWMP